MKKLTTLILILLCAVTLFAQAPEKFTYQAVVRNANNTLVANAQVGVRVNILQGTATGSAVYSETHMVSSNANGLVTLNIGAGSVLHGSFANIDWADGPYFLKTDIDPNGGNDYNITSTQQLLSVPYALYAKEAANSFSGDYNDLTNTPQIPTVPTNVGAFANDAGYLTSFTETDPTVPAWAKEANKPTYSYSEITNTPTIPTIPNNVSTFTNDAGYITNTDIPAQVNADWNATSGAARILNKPTLFSGNYSDLVGKPTNLSQFNNDLGLATVATSGSYNDLNYRPNLATVAITGNYNDLSNRPTIPTVPTNVSAFTNDAGYVTSADVQQAAGVPTNLSAFNNDMGYLTSFTETDPTVPAWAKEANKPTYSYSEITNTPTIPTIPNNVSTFTNDAGYITNTDIPAQVNADWNATSGAARILNKPTLFSGNYSDLVGKPTNLSQFNNDLGLATVATSGSYNDLNYRPNLATVATTGNYNDLINRPTIPTVPTNVSAFTNDAGYITDYTETDPLFTAWDKDYNDLTNRPVIPTVPDSVSAFVNDAGYLTSYTEQQELSISNDTIFLTGGSFVKLPAAAVGFSGDYNDLINKPVMPAVPDSVSAFVNDAGYLTSYTETDPLFTAWDKDYNDLMNKPTIPTVPTNISAFTNDAGYITMDSIPAFPTIPTNVSVFENDAHYITDVQLQQIMSTIATMQNTIDSMGLVMEALYNQINQPDSTQETTDTSLQVTFTTRISAGAQPTTHNAMLATSDQSSINDIDHYQGMAVPGNTGGIERYWVVFCNNYGFDVSTTIINTNKNVIVSDVKIWSAGSWAPMSPNIVLDTTSGNEFKYARHDGFGDIYVEQCYIAIKIVVEE